MTTYKYNKFILQIQLAGLRGGQNGFLVIVRASKDVPDVFCSDV